MKNNEMSEFAFKAVKDMVNKNGEKEFRSLSRSFPSMIQKNGLGTAVAYIKADEEAGITLYNILNNWMKTKWEIQDLLESIVSSESMIYRIYTDEVMRLCIWIKRFVEGMMVNNG